MAAGDLLLLNARVMTMAGNGAPAEAIAARGGQVVVVGSAAACRQAAPAGAPVLDCGGRSVIPGIVDAHIHLLSWAAALTAVDCSGARSIEEIVALLRERAQALPPGTWLRATGYDEWRLAEGRHPQRWDLDRASDTHPIRLIHRSGHALVLNTLAMERAGITIASEEPPGGVIDRRLSDGEPTGLLLEMGEAVAPALPPLARAELVAGLREAGGRLVAAGVTYVQDMTHTNDTEAIRFLAEIAAEAGFPPGWSAAEGWSGAAALLPADGPAPVKIMLREAGGAPVPDEPALTSILRACAERGRRVAVHAVSAPAVEMAVNAFTRAGLSGAAQRIEHAGVCLPATAARIAALGLTVVSNPGFLWFSGDRYCQTAPEEQQPYLYDAAGLLAAGVPVAAGSDAPVTPPAPLAAMHAAVSRRSRSGVLLPGVGVTPLAAQAMHTTHAAAAATVDRERGSITPGRRADLLIVEGEPGTATACPAATVIRGRVAWSNLPSVAATAG